MKSQKPLKNNLLLSPKKLRRRFNQAFDTYANCAVVQQRMAKELIERLEFFTINPDTIINLGCGLGELSLSVKEIYSQSTIINLDFAEKMLTKNDYSQYSITPLLADSHHIPIKKNSIDLIISNAMIPWSYNIIELFKEIKRILKEDGLFIFTTFGTETLKEWQAAWRQSSPYKFHSVNNFIDMHDIADTLMSVGFSHPVMDKGTIKVNYQSLNTLIEDLKGMGSKLTHPKQYRGLSTQNQWDTMKKNYQRGENNCYPCTWEMIHGHCFNAAPPPPKYPQPFEIPLSALISKNQ